MLLSVTTTHLAMAVEVAPRISDREIIEGLAEVKTLRTEMNVRFDGVNVRFDAQQKEMNARFDGVNARFDAQQKQIDYIGSLMIAMLVSMFTLFGGLIGFIVWDRQTVVRPLEARVALMHEEFEEERRIRIGEQPQILKIIEVLKNVAKTDGRIAEALRGVNLL